MNFKFNVIFLIFMFNAFSSEHAQAAKRVAVAAETSFATAALGSEVARLKYLVDFKDAQIKALERSLNLKTQSRLEAGEKIKELNSEIFFLKNQVASLTEQLNSSIQERVNLRSHLVALENYCLGLQSTIVGLCKKIELLESQAHIQPQSQFQTQPQTQPFDNSYYLVMQKQLQAANRRFMDIEDSRSRQSLSFVLRPKTSSVVDSSFAFTDVSIDPEDPFGLEPF